jgi:hypothetical protein
MKTMDPAADARFDPVAPVALERFRIWLGFLARLHVEPRLRASRPTTPDDYEDHRPYLPVVKSARTLLDP